MTLTQKAKQVIAANKLTEQRTFAEFVVKGIKHTKYLSAIQNSLVYHVDRGFGVVVMVDVDEGFIRWLSNSENAPEKINLVDDKHKLQTIFFSADLPRRVPNFHKTPEEVKAQKKLDDDRRQKEQIERERRHTELRLFRETKAKKEKEREETRLKKKQDKERNQRELEAKRREEFRRLEVELAEKRAREYKTQEHEVLKALNVNPLVADKLMHGKNKIWRENFSKIKRTWLRGIEDSLWLNRNENNRFSEAQLDAIEDVSDYCLLRARAGSGKTTVLNHKIDFLITVCDVQPHEVMALAFNSPAAAKIKKNLQGDFRHITFENSRTFHSLAYRIVNPRGDILFDQDEGPNALQSKYVESLLRDEINPAIKKIIYEFFRREMAELENLGSLLDDDDFYRLRRNSTYETLAGQRVRSKGEKWIADYLFEHDYWYEYEKPWDTDNHNLDGRYKPDFSINISRNYPDVILEHWGIDEDDICQKLPDFWSQSWHQYHESMVKKRKYWNDFNKRNPQKAVAFIETSVADMRQGREEFERILEDKIKAVNGNNDKLPQEILDDRIVKNCVPRLARSINAFISRAKLSRITPDDLNVMISDFTFDSERERIFVNLASRLYWRYQQNLNGRIDYNDLMREAVEKIHEKKGLISIKGDGGNSIDLHQLRWIMVDEYQDFSPLFYDLIDALRTYNTALKIFCVGDDWQAISGFSGADTKFFKNFGSYFEGAKVLDLPDNYRSQEVIVEQSNKFMKNYEGVPSLVKRHDIPSNPLIKLFIDDVYIDYSAQNANYDRFKTLVMQKGVLRNFDKGYVMARLFRLCWQIMKRHSLSETSFMILNRTHAMGSEYRYLSDFKNKLKNVFKDEIVQFSDFDSQVRCDTVHKSKGLDAEVVIILNICERQFPLIHPDTNLSRILGVSVENAYQEEERLFYVAITRAKQRVYLVTEKHLQSEFMDNLDAETLTFGKYLA